MMQTSLPTRTGIVSGTLLSTVWSIGLHDVIQTAILAGVGATVSFTVTLILQRIRNNRRR